MIFGWPVWTTSKTATKLELSRFCGWFSIFFDDFEKLSNNISRALWVFVIYVVDFGKKFA